MVQFVCCLQSSGLGWAKRDCHKVKLSTARHSMAQDGTAQQQGIPSQEGGVGGEQGRM